MHIVYSGPSPLDFSTLDPPLHLVPGETVELPLSDVQRIRESVPDEQITFLDGVIVSDECPTCHHVETRLEEVTPPVKGTLLRASFDGTLTHPVSQRSYTFSKGEDFEVDPADVQAFLDLDLAGQRLVDLDAVPAVLDGLKKSDLMDLADRLGLDEHGTVADLRGRVERWRAGEPEPVEPDVA